MEEKSFGVIFLKRLGHIYNMFAAPPNLTTTAIKLNNSKKLLDFYGELGILFNIEYKENSQKFYSYIISYPYYNSEFRFEIHDVEHAGEASQNVSLTFTMDEIDGYVEGLVREGGTIVKDSWITENYQHILLNDPNGHLVELVTKVPKNY